MILYIAVTTGSQRRVDILRLKSEDATSLTGNYQAASELNEYKNVEINHLKQQDELLPLSSP